MPDYMDLVRVMKVRKCSLENNQLYIPLTGLQKRCAENNSSRAK